LNNLIKEAEEKAISIFDIKIPLTINEEEFHSVSEPLGEYNYYEDNIAIYINKIQYLTKKYELNIEKMINYSVCHEYGHAKQARIFEEQQFFPIMIGKYRKCVYDFERIKISSEDFHQFITNLLDFCINKELKNFEIVDPAVKIALDYLEPSGPEEYVQFILTKNLPKHIGYYEFSGLSESERNDMKSRIVNHVGEKWDYTCEIMRSLEFSNVENYIKKQSKLIEYLLKQRVYYKELSSEEIFRGRNRPTFWNKTSYFVTVISQD